MTQPPSQPPANKPINPAAAGQPAQASLPQAVLPKKLPYNPIESLDKPDPVLIQTLITPNFPLSDRMVMKMCGCCYRQESFSNEMLGKAPLFKFEDEFKEDYQKQFGLKIKIKGTGSLQLDPNVLHPFVRMHILDLKTWKPLAKQRKNIPGVANRESVQMLKETGQFEQKDVDYFLPIATQFFDMRIQGQNSCHWNEEFIINECAPNILKENVVFLFEILEVNSQLIQEHQTDKLTAELFYPVAWAYLRPLGTAMTHTSRTRLQLYRYKFKYTQEVAQNWPYDKRTPAVFLDFEFTRKTAYPSYLEIDLQFCNRSDEQIPRKHYSRAPWEREVDLYKLKHEVTDEDRPVNPGMSDDVMLRRWEKFLDLPSMLPDERLRKLDTDAQGALRLEFSTRGKYIAVACTTSQKSKTLIKIFDITKDERPLVILRGHFDLIHDMNWSKDDNFLVSASADGSVKVWDLSDLETTNENQRMNYTDNDKIFMLTQLMHPSFVYGSKIHPNQDVSPQGRPLIVASVCFDQKVRIWRVFTAGSDRTLHRMEIEISIMEKPLKTLGQKQSIYELDQLDDETLALIMRPERKIKVKRVVKEEPSIAGAQRNTVEKKTVVTEEVDGTYFDQTHPNCLVFSELGRLFVGDSKGSISVWDVELRQGTLVVENHFKITHKELDGDQINQIQVHPEFTNQIFVQSRDNCIRLIQYESARGIRIKKRFFGSQCKDMMVRCTISPDGQYIVAGSQDGKPRIWGASLEEVYNTAPYECKLLDLVSDVAWNPRYNMFALSGFGQHFPVLIYVYSRTEEELNKYLLSGAGISIDSDRAAQWYKERIERQAREILEQQDDLQASGVKDGSRRATEIKGFGDSFARSSHKL